MVLIHAGLTTMRAKGSFVGNVTKYVVSTKYSWSGTCIYCWAILFVPTPNFMVLGFTHPSEHCSGYFVFLLYLGTCNCLRS